MARATSGATQYGSGETYIGNGGSTIQDYTLPVSRVRVKQVHIQYEGVWNSASQSAFLQLCAQDSRTGKWVAVPTGRPGGENGVHPGPSWSGTLSDAERFVHGGTGRLCLRLSASNGSYRLRRLGISVEGERR